MTDKLKACPWCGSRAVIRSGTRGFNGVCVICHATGPADSTDALGAAAWNRRSFELAEPPEHLPPHLEDWDGGWVFWREIVLEMIKGGNSHEGAVAVADRVLAAERERRGK